MGDPVTWSILATVASAGVGAYSSIQQGKAGAEAAQFERAQYEEQAAMSKMAALDEEADRRRRLTQVLASNRAASVGLGISGDSRSFLAIQDDSKLEAERDVGRIRLNAASQARRYNLAAEQSSLSAKSAMKSGYIGAGASLLKGGYDYSQLKQA